MMIIIWYHKSKTKKIRKKFFLQHMLQISFMHGGKTVCGVSPFEFYSKLRISSWFCQTMSCQLHAWVLSSLLTNNFSNYLLFCFFILPFSFKSTSNLLDYIESSCFNCLFREKKCKCLFKIPIKSLKHVLGHSGKFLLKKHQRRQLSLSLIYIFTSSVMEIVPQLSGFCAGFTVGQRRK